MRLYTILNKLSTLVNQHTTQISELNSKTSVPFDDTTASSISDLCVAKFNLVVSRGRGTYFVGGGWKSHYFGFSIVSVIDASNGRGIVVFVGQSETHIAYIDNSQVSIIKKVTTTAVS